jgi:pimeloyl-ACP methyl ester carboxylesterase
LGGTGCPHAALDVREAVAAISELLRAEQDRGPIVLGGVSLGGWVALRTALAHPELVAGVALVNPAGYRDQDWDQVRNLIDVRSLAQVAAMQRALFVRQAWWLWAARPFFYQVFTQQSVRDLISRIQESDAYSAEELAAFRVPTGLFWGDRDGLFPLAIGHAMARAIPGSKLYVFAESAHATVMERPDALTEAFEDFDRSLGVTLPPSEATRV